MADDRGEDKRSPVRPTVIEGEAQDITPKDEDGPEKSAETEKAETLHAADEDNADQARAEAASEEDKAASGADETQGGGADTDDESGKAADATSARAEENEAASAAPAPRKSRTGLKILGVLLLMGASAGGGIWAWNEYGPMKKLTAMQAQLAELETLKDKLAALDKSVSTGAAKTDALQARLDALEKAVAELDKRQKALTNAAGTTGKQAIAEVSARLNSLEKRIQELSAAIESGKGASEKALRTSQGNAQRIAALDKTLKDVQTRLAALSAGLDALARSGGAQEGEAGGTQATAAASAVIAVKLAGLEKAVEELQKRLSAVENRVSSPTIPEDVKKRLADINARLDALQKRLQAVADTASSAQNTARNALAAIDKLKKAQAGAQPPAVGIAFAQLREKVLSGAPYAAELERMKGWLPGTAALDALSAYADKGLAPEAELIRQLADLARHFEDQRRQALEEARKQGLLGNLKARLGEVVKVRRADSTDWAEALAQARTLAQTEGLAAAVRDLEARPGEKPREVAAWLQAAKARVEADAALDTLSERVLAMIATGAKNTAKAGKGQ
ncbi:COG4223 family protein [Thermopetrobacter sp. TC1]|uniref:COG4223 family protein n=1 Tax=Thermopetrobacter sp. TC1 TaxID=1495045 RepID=UPI00057028B1|nr:hypothetical protein [Thermopetrobacter sp. TC1]